MTQIRPRVQGTTGKEEDVPYVAVVLTHKEAAQCASQEALEGIVQRVHAAHGPVSLCFLLVKLLEEVQLEASREFKRVCAGGARQWRVHAAGLVHKGILRPTITVSRQEVRV